MRHNEGGWQEGGFRGGAEARSLLLHIDDIGLKTDDLHGRGWRKAACWPPPAGICLSWSPGPTLRIVAPNPDDRTVGRILQKVDIKPHRFAYWLNPKIADEQQFHEQVETICKLSKQAPAMGALNMRVVSTDENTGIQALSRIADDIPSRPGCPQRLEFEYRRNGTVSLIPNFGVVTGKTIEFTVHETRDELTFADLVRRTVQVGDPETTWIFVLDQLNTHKSETLVWMVDEPCGLNADLGERGKGGILATLASREAFLRDSRHRLRFVYTPKHCSWLNQVEIWFGVITRKLLKRGNFSSTEQLNTSIGQFIDYYNRTMAEAMTVTERQDHWRGVLEPLSA